MPTRYCCCPWLPGPRALQGTTKHILHYSVGQCKVVLTEKVPSGGTRGLYYIFFYKFLFLVEKLRYVNVQGVGQVGECGHAEWMHSIKFRERTSLVVRPALGHPEKRVYVLVIQSCLTLCNPMDCRLPVFPRQEYWNGLPVTSPGNFPDLGIEPGSPTLQADSLPSESPGN